ncbi:MAG: CPBP family intramembrane glutamic endopeptidase [Isosphaeraceae bacterium]
MEQPRPRRDRQVLFESEDDDDQPGRDVIIMFAVFFEGGLAPLSLLLGWWWGHNPLQQFSWNAGDALKGVIAALPMIGLFLVVLRWPIGPLRKIKSFCEDEFVPLLAGSSWSDMALIAISAGVGEEMLFRGAIQTSLGAWLGDLWGLSLAGLLFGMLHPISIPYIVVTFGVGLFLGGEYVYTGNLLAVIVTHALYDFALMGYLLRCHYHGGPSMSIPTVDPDADIDDRDRL